MKQIYVVISYFKNIDGAFSIKRIDGYTFILRTAELYINTHDGMFDILVYEGITNEEIFEQIYYEYGYDINTDVELFIKIWPSKDGSYHIAETTEAIEELLSEVGIVDGMISTAIESYVKMLTIASYMKDNNFGIILNYITSTALTTLSKWIDECEMRGYYLGINHFPLDLVNALVINGYMTPIESIKGDSHNDTIGD